MRRASAGKLAGALALACGLCLAGGLRADDKGKSSDHHRRGGAMESCMKACVECARQCESCFDHCAHLTAQGKREHLATAKTCVDCGDICSLAAKVLARNGALSAQICDGCAKACDACAAACEKHPEDEHMKACAKACRDCAKECRAMIRARSPGTGPRGGESPRER